MTPEEFRGAFTAWSLAIGDKSGDPEESKSFEELALEYGKRITNQENLDIVSDCFDFEKITQLIEESRKPHGTKKD